MHKPIVRISYFRFYEELNDFLPRAYHKKMFAFEFTGKPSVKNVIEAIGIPHIEVDLVLLDGVSVDFDHHLFGGEHVSVYPVFETLDIAPLIHLREKPLRVSKFIVDVNLGKLAQKLRLLGFDTLFRNDYEDQKIVEISIKEKRIILTRDKGVLRYGNITHGYWIRNEDPKKQLKEIIWRLQLQNSFKPFTRCSLCNELLFPADKEQVEEQLTVDTLTYYDKFMKCSGCSKIYWYGSHFKEINTLIESLKKINSLSALSL